MTDPYLFPPLIGQHIDPLTSAKIRVCPLISSKFESIEILIASLTASLYRSLNYSENSLIFSFIISYFSSLYYFLNLLGLT